MKFIVDELPYYEGFALLLRNAALMFEWANVHAIGISTQSALTITHMSVDIS